MGIGTDQNVLAELRAKLVPHGTSDIVVIRSQLFTTHDQVTAALNSLETRIRFAAMGLEELTPFEILAIQLLVKAA